MKKVSVLLPTNTNQTYDYLVPKEKEIDIRSFVSVSFRNKQMNGIVWFESGDEVDKAKLKNILEVYSGIKLKKNYIKFLDFSKKMLSKGATILGGCCETKPFHIEKISILKN